MWEQNYNPLGNAAFSTIAAAVPVVTLLGLVASGRLRTHIAAVIALLVANVVAIAVFAMPARVSLSASLFGILSGFFPAGWLLLNLVFFYRVTVATGRFDFLRHAIFAVTADRRLQLLLIAFAFGAFLEGARGAGIAVAIVAAVLAGIGFSPLAASGLALIGNSAAVAFGAQGAPILSIASTADLDPLVAGAMVGRQAPFLSLLVPFCLIAAFAGWRGMVAIWPAILVSGVSFAIAQFAISNFINPWIVDTGASLISMTCLILFLRIWQPGQIWTSAALRGGDASAVSAPAVNPSEIIKLSRSQFWSALLPWIIVCIVMLIVRAVRHDRPDAAAGSMCAGWDHQGLQADPAQHQLLHSLPVVGRHRLSGCGDCLRAAVRLVFEEDGRGVSLDAAAVRHSTGCDLRGAGSRHIVMVVGNHRDAWGGLRGNRPAASLLRQPPWLAGRCRNPGPMPCSVICTKLLPENSACRPC